MRVSLHSVGVGRVGVRRVGVLLGMLALMLGIGLPPAQAGQAKKAPAPAAKPTPNLDRPGGNRAGGNRAGGAKQVPTEQLEKLLNMSPEERQKALSKLPPQQRKQLQTRLDNLDRMTPAQRQQNLERARQLEALPPARRQAVRNQIQSMNKLSFADQRDILNSPEFAKNFSPEEQQILRERFPQAASNVVRPIDKLAPARRQAVNQEMQRINKMPFQERRQALHSPEFNQNFSPEEQEILRNRFPAAGK